MPDIVMCKKYNCPKANECYRLRAISLDKYQAYTDFISICNDLDDYHFFMKIRPEDEVIELEEILENQNSKEVTKTETEASNGEI
ncbi:MAG: hypothetical protein LLF98_01835 [Clostridium sp.]|uniref:hypothetical protein n=1 Tax=Clostridium sp. TaxID=1506 RepID=UPI0025BBDF58|nr:hypothetical protein [Clostridium sp.]MCE5220021.1 hypothetical protein [Clostridium sp.]